MVQHLLPRVAIVPLRLNNLQSLRFAPRASRDSDHLEAGVLQLPTGTYTVVDETVMSAGKINEQGVHNLSALRTLATSAMLEYDFHYPVPFTADLPLLTLSSSKSITPAHVVLPLQPTTPGTDAVPSKDFLLAARVLLANARELSFTIPEAVSATAQTMLVELRSQGVSPDGLYVFMDIVRLAALSFGEQELTNERLQWAWELEAKRRARVKAREAAAPAPAARPTTAAAPAQTAAPAPPARG